MTTMAARGGNLRMGVFLHELWLVLFVDKTLLHHVSESTLFCTLLLVAFNFAMNSRCLEKGFFLDNFS